MIQILRKFFALKFFVVGLFLVPFLVYAFTSPGNPSGYVNDFASVFTLEQKSALENKLSLFNASTTNEITVVTVKNLGGDYIEHYAVELFKAWGIGTKKNDNGVLLLIAIEDRAMRIEVGYGLEGALTDSISAQIIRDDLTPAFRQNDFYGGIDTATNNIIKVTQGEYVSTVDSSQRSSGGSASWEFIIFIFVTVVQFLGSILGRSKSWWAGGVLGGALGGVIMLSGFLGISLVVGGVITSVLVLLGLLFDYIVSHQYASSVRSGSSIPWWAGGGRGGGSSFGGGSFGGFSGGSSGGGGASGRW